MRMNSVPESFNIATNSGNETVIRVLCVDDETSLLDATKSILELHTSFQIETASSVDDALQIMNEKEFDVIVSDYQMPIKSGLDFLREIREKGNNVPFILFTGKGREEVAVKALNLGADRYFNKIGHPETVYGELAHGIRQSALQRRAEKKIWDREERLRAIIASSPDAMIITDLHGNLIDCNIETLKFLGVSSKKEIMGADCYNFIANEEIERVKKPVQELLEQGAVNNVECKLVPKNGSRIDVEFSANILRDAYGKPVGVVVLARNITERKKAEERLRKSEEKYRSIVELSPDGIATMNMKGIVTSINKAFVDLTGFSKDEIVGKHFTKLGTLRIQDVPKYIKLITAVLRGKKHLRTEFLYLRKDRTKRLGEAYIELIEEKGEKLGLQAILRDITEEKKIQQVLKESEEKYRNIVEMSPDGMISLDTNGIVTAVNRAILEQTGFTKTDFVGKHYTQLEAVQAENLSELTKKINSFFNGEILDAFEIWYCCKNGKHLCAEATVGLLKHNDKVVGLQLLFRDITEYNKNKDNLVKERDTLEKVTGNLSASLLVLSKDLHILWTNKYIKNILGDISGKCCYSALNRLDHICPGCKIEHVIETGKQAVFEITLQNPQGQNLPEGQDLILEITAIPIKDKKGNVTEVLELALDITERKNMENAIREAEEKHRVLIDSTNVFITSVDEDGKYIYVNKEWKRVFGYSDEEIKKITILDTVRSDHKKQCLQDVQLVSNGKAVTEIETVFVTKNGKEIHARGNARPIISNGKVISTVAVFLDITEHKKAEEELKQSEKRFRELSELLPEVVFESNSKGILTFVNHAAHSQFGYSKEEFDEGLTPSQFIAHQDRERAESNLAKLMTGKESGPNEYLAIRKDGTTFPVTIKSTPIIHNGKTVGIRGIMVDLTEHMKTQDRLKHTLTNLESLNEKLGVVGKLSRHDVKNKLSIILNNAFLIRNQLNDNQTTALKQLKDIEVAVEQIEKILDFTRIYEMLGTQEKTTINVKTILDEAFMLAAQAYEIELVNECENLTVQADSLLRQVFYNLIENTLKHGETVTTIKVNYEETENGLNLIFTDDGIGIPTNQKELIFREGYGKGTGYGLYLIQKICEEYGWTIGETGKPGEGAQFTICIPEWDCNKKKQLHNQKTF